MLRDFQATLTVAGTDDAAEGTATLWLHPEDTPTATERFGALPVPLASMDQRTEWLGIFDAPYQWNDEAPVGSVFPAVLSFATDAATRVVRAVCTGQTRAPAILGTMVLGESILGDGRGSAAWALHGDDAIPDGIAGTGDASPGTVPRDPRLESIDIVEKLTYEVEDTAEDEATRAMARAVREYLDALRAHVSGDASEDVIRSVVSSLRTLGEHLVTVTQYAGVANLGYGILRLVGAFG